VTRPTVVALPGAALMRLALLDGGRLRIECPGCGATAEYRPRPGVQHQPFRHAFDSCPTLVAIDHDARAAGPVPEVVQ
jgi:hypothetical protein